MKTYTVPSWANDSERLIQRVVFYLTNGGEWVESDIDMVRDMRGTEAWSELSWELSTGEEPVVYPDDCEGAEGEVYGYEYEDRGYRVEYWDCDDMAYSEMYPDED